MPPEGEPQPEPPAKKAFLDTLRVELAHAGVGLDTERLRRPEFGNYVDHEKLFDGSVTALPATKARLWLNKDVSGSNPGEFKDYAALKRLEEDEQSRPLSRMEPMKSPVPRAGVLTHPAWLLARSTFDHSDVVRRGKWIRERLLGGTIPDVPIGHK